MDNKQQTAASVEETVETPSPLPLASSANLPLWQDRGFWLTAYALGHDLAVLLLFTFAALMTVDGLMPGFISSHLNFAKFLFGLAALLFLLIAIGRKEDVSFPVSKPRKRLIGSLLAWSALLTINALLKFPPLASLVILILTAAIGRLLYQLFFTEEK
jgi:hypothetical protein